MDEVYEKEPLTIKYIFRFPDDRRETFEVTLDGESIEPIDDRSEALPQWTQLDFEQCPNCPLSVETHSHCPLAARLVKVVNICENLLSYDKIRMHVVTAERMISKHTTAQQGISALMGLIMATSGCPLTSFFKPMARFHLPLASGEETIYRATSMYLLAQYFLRKEGRESDLELDGLTEIYRDMQILNSAIAKRIRAAIQEDAAVNAIVLLDFFAKTLPYVLEESLEEIRYLFTPFLTQPERNDELLAISAD